MKIYKSGLAFIKCRCLDFYIDGAGNKRCIHCQKRFKLNKSKSLERATASETEPEGRVPRVSTKRAKASEGETLK
jgi:hypothetical protein